MPKQPRFNFSDYSAEQQEIDAQRIRPIKVIRHAYLMKINGEWAHFIVGQSGEDIDYYEDLKLDQVYKKVKEKYPEHTPKVIQNQGLENYLKDRRPEIMKRKHFKQLSINFKERE